MTCHLSLAAALVMLAGLTAPTPVLAAGDANASSCASQTEASSGFVTYLPDCRAYESVVPPYKEGGVVIGTRGTGAPSAVSPDGSRVIGFVGGPFAGAGNFWWQGNRNPNFDAYEFTRTSSGWAPTVLTPPATEFPHSAMLAANANDLSTTLWSAATNTLELNEEIYLRNEAGKFELVGPGTGPEVRHEDIPGSTEELTLAGASRDLSHTLFSIKAFSAGIREGHHGHGNLWPGDTTKESASSLYEYAYRGQPLTEPTLVGVENTHQLLNNTEAKLISRCGTVLGSGEGSSGYNAVSDTGGRVFFTALHASEGQECETPAVNELYARIAGTETVAISEPSKEHCEICQTPVAQRANATFQGASSDGQQVFFLTEQELLSGHTGMNLYEYDFAAPGASPEHPTGRVSLVSSGVETPEVQGVVRVSEDGSHVYFVAKGVLAGANGEGDTPLAGADNLYVYEPDPAAPGNGHNVFVATLLTPTEEAVLQSAEALEEVKVAEAAGHAAYGAYEQALAKGDSEAEALRIYGEVETRELRELTGALGPAGTLAADRSLWGLADKRPAQATPNGQFLAFTSSARLVAGDESSVPQLFEYDADTGTLARVSTGQHSTRYPGGYDNDGNVQTYTQAPEIPAPYFLDGIPTRAESGLAISNDGARVFFTSAARLTPQVEDPTSTNVYEYTDGDVYLISDGKDGSRTSEEPTTQLYGIDPSGQDALFLSADALVPQAPVGQVGLYDAHIEGGFAAPTLTPGCLGETCRGAAGLTPQLQSPATTSQTGGGNLPAPLGSKPAISKPKPLTRADKLRKALKVCRVKRSKKRRVACAARARERYGPNARRRKRGTR